MQYRSKVLDPAFRVSSHRALQGCLAEPLRPFFWEDMDLPNASLHHISNLFLTQHSLNAASNPAFACAFFLLDLLYDQEVAFPDPNFFSKFCREQNQG